MKTFFTIAWLVLPVLAARAEVTERCDLEAQVQTCQSADLAKAPIELGLKRLAERCLKQSAEASLAEKLRTDCDAALPAEGKEHLDTIRLKSCADRWLKHMLETRRSVSAIQGEEAELAKAALPETVPDACAAAAERNSSLLRELSQRFQSRLAIARSALDLARAKTDEFHVELARRLLPMGHTDPSKRYISFSEEPGLPVPQLEDVKSLGVIEMVTIYKMAFEIEHQGPKDTALQVGDEQIMTTKAFVKELRLEGTGVLADGRLVNTAGRGRYAFIPIVRAPYGLGSYKRTPLEPMRSIAVDPKKIPLGSWVYIHEARGLPLQPHGDGTPLFHDGFFRAVDVGAMINGSHIDIFAGHDKTDFKTARGWFYKKAVHYYVLKETPAVSKTTQ